VAPQCSPHPPDTIYLKILILSSYFCFDSPDVSASCCIFSPSRICHITFPCRVHGASPPYQDCFLQLQYVLGRVSSPFCVCVCVCVKIGKCIFGMSIHSEVFNFSKKSLKPESDSFLSFTFQFITFTTPLFLALQTELP